MGKRWGALALVLLAGAVGCGNDDVDASEPVGTTATTTVEEETPGFPESEADTVLEYKLVDYAFEGPSTAKGPKVYFEAENEGTQEHELEVLDPDGEPVGEIEAFPPGGTSEPLAVELEPGTYTLQCLVETPEGKVHKDLGMVADLTVE